MAGAATQHLLRAAAMIRGQRQDDASDCWWWQGRAVRSMIGPGTTSTIV